MNKWILRGDCWPFNSKNFKCPPCYIIFLSRSRDGLRGIKYKVFDF